MQKTAKPTGRKMARLSDTDVELMRVMHETHGKSYRTLSGIFEVPKSTVQSLCKYRRR